MLAQGQPATNTVEATQPTAKESPPLGANQPVQKLTPWLEALTAFSRWPWTFMHRADQYVTGTASVRIFPDGLKSPHYGLNIPFSQIGPLASFGWGFMAWFGNVTFSQSFGTNLHHIQPPTNDSARVQSGSGFVDFGLGYTVVEWGGLRLTPTFACGFGGVVVRDLRPNGYLYVGGEIDVSYVFPLFQGSYNPDLHIISQPSILISCRVGYVENFTAFASDWRGTHGTLHGRLTLGIGFHSEKVEVPRQ